MSQCVPSWDLEDKLREHHPQTSHSLPHDVPTLDYEVAELRWENGQPSILGLPRAANKYPAASAAVWDNPPHSSATGDTLESVVNQATTRRHKPSAASELVPWYDHHHHHQEAAVDVPTMKSTPHTRAFLDALVPCGNKNQNNRINKEAQQHSTTHVPAGISTCMVSSCSVACTQGNLDLSEGGKFGGGRDHRCRHAEAVEGSEYVGGGGFASELSPENTSSGGREYTRSRTSGDDSVCHSMSQQRETGDKEIVKKRSTGTLGKSSVSTKRSRAAAIHNQSERRRRDKINQRMKTLQKLVPNSSKTDKASMLDEVIEYLKQLQAQVYLMSRTTTPPPPPMMLPFMQQHLLQMPNVNMMPPPLGMGMGLGLGSIMDFSAMTQAAAAGAAHAIQPNAAFMPSAIGSWDNSGGDRLVSTHDALSAFLACQMQPMTMDTYSRLAALYQQFQQPPPCGSKD